jgi:integrase
MAPTHDNRSAKAATGLYLRGGVWHIDKIVRRIRVCESTGTRDRDEAQELLAKRIYDIRQAVLFGVRPDRTFRQAATKYLEDYTGVKDSIADDADHIAAVMDYIGDLPLRQVHTETLKPFVRKRQEDGRKTKTINLALGVVRHILNLAAYEWRDEHGLTWLEHPPKIRMLPVTDAREPYPLTWVEQAHLFSELPTHLQKMALFKVNTGCREQEVCQLRWTWERAIEGLGETVFVVPARLEDGRGLVKNRQNRLVVLNSIARSVIEERREVGRAIQRRAGIFPEHVFTYSGHAVGKINNSAWKSARKRAADRYEEVLGRSCPEGFRRVRVHDLKHTFGKRLRAAGVGFEDRQDLLGHKSGRVTTHYSGPEIRNLRDAAEAACQRDPRKSPARGGDPG